MTVCLGTANGRADQLSSRPWPPSPPMRRSTLTAMRPIPYRRLSPCFSHSLLTTAHGTQRRDVEDMDDPHLHPVDEDADDPYLKLDESPPGWLAHLSNSPRRSRSRSPSSGSDAPPPELLAQPARTQTKPPARPPTRPPPRAGRHTHLHLNLYLERRP